MRTSFAPVVLLLLAATSLPAAAQPPCAPHQALIEALARQYGEAVTGSGITAGGRLVELLTSPSGTWTMIETRPGGLTCIVGTGDSWIASPVSIGGREN